VVMVTHDPGAAGWADRVVFLADGKIVDEMVDPTTARVLEKLKDMES
ncbi:MAG: ABC transporter ATP-binding protein, partial [Acidimicrobiia bacterium]|nr:ABC transporter ATP-binding protein [Acidimicrobiia bacterium]